MMRNGIVSFVSVLCLGLVACTDGTYVLKSPPGDSAVSVIDAQDGVPPCEGYNLEVVGSGEMETGWHCLPARPFFDLPGPYDQLDTHPQVINMTWLIEVAASPEARANAS